MYIKSIHVIATKTIENERFFEVEIQDVDTTVKPYVRVWGKQQLEDYANDYSIEVTYEEDEECEIEYQLRRLFVGYIEIDSYADGSNEHDVYSHEAKFEDGKLTWDFEGTFLKTYKRIGSAKKFAESFNLNVKVN